jgi:hypothetical protein
MYGGRENQVPHFQYYEKRTESKGKTVHYFTLKIKKGLSKGCPLSQQWSESLMHFAALLHF